MPINKPPNTKHIYLYYTYIDSDEMSKLISVTNDVYAMLYRIKGSQKSFSDVIMQLVTKQSGKGDIMKYAGALKGDAGLEAMRSELKRRRSTAKGRIFRGI